ncbi:MAG TPA: GNAT family N-acetyltransferase [candidate division Zixibacteria bacterium]|nr:GNAT family N-acetyltransferase [candidate division Zixibacteria bacterium]
MADEAKPKTPKTERLASADIEVSLVKAPLNPGIAWEVESLLLKIFEYGDYSFRSALLGEYSRTLNCTFFMAKHKGSIVGAAGCLYARKNPAIAIIGPVGVAVEFRLNGIGTKLVTSAIEHLRRQNCMAIYLGVSAGTSASSLYTALGFEKYKGIVMRLLLCPEAQFTKDWFGKCPDVKVRRATWGDFPGIQALLAFPCRMYTSDFRRNIFSSRYVEPTRFLSVFPEMMRAFARHGGFANVLVAGHNENVVGFAHISRLPGEAQRHTAELDFYLHDNFVDQTERLVRTTIEGSRDLTINRINCYCLGCDHLKRNIIDKLGGRQIAVLRDNIFVSGKYEDVLVYQFGEGIYAKG